MFPNNAKTIGALVLCITLTVTYVMAADPYPGMSCNWGFQCNTNQTRMKCRGYNAPPVCVCESFMADAKYNVTSVPEYNSDVKMCVVKKGFPCLVDEMAIQCEPKHHCDVSKGPKTKDAGLCSAGTGAGSRIPIIWSAAMLMASFAVALSRL